MIDTTGINLSDPYYSVTSKRISIADAETDRTTRRRDSSLNKAIERLYSDRLKRRFTDVLHSDISQSSRVPRNEGLYKQYLQLLQAYLPPGGEINILEIGCGSGKFCQSLFEHGYRACGIDRSHLLLQQARQIAPDCEFERAGAYVSFKDLFVRRFDAVVYLDAIERLHSPRHFIERALESLLPGGLLITTARYRGYMINLTDALRGSTPNREVPVERAETTRNGPTTLGRLLKDCGLEIVEFQKAGLSPQPWRSQLFVARKPATLW